jgi:molecular chaperone GrpE
MDEQVKEKLSEKQDNEVKPTEENNELAKLKEENAKLNDHILRLGAELENTRKRLTKEANEASQYAITKFARDLIEVLENLHRAEASIHSSEELEGNQTLKAIFSGVELTKKSLVDSFEKHGIQRVEPNIGDKFDHNYHQAIAQVPATSHPADSIVQVIQAGYIIHDRLLRPALVAVAK